MTDNETCLADKSVLVKQIFLIDIMINNILIEFLLMDDWISTDHHIHFPIVFFSRRLSIILSCQGHPTICSAKYLFLWPAQLASKMNRSCEQIWRFSFRLKS